MTVPPGPEGTLLTLSKQALHGPFVQVRAQPVNGASTDVRVLIQQRLHSTSGFPWKTPQRVRLRLAGMAQIFSLIPDFQLPPGTEVEGNGYSNSLTSAQTSAILRTDLTLPALAAFYTPQLARAGWEPLATDSSEHVFWSTWAVKDEAGEQWRGVLFVLQMPDQPQEYHLYVHFRWLS